MSELPLVSVVIIFYNAESFLAEAVDSVLHQTYRHWELLLVDDGSTDGSREIADHYARLYPRRIHVVQHPGNQNRGMPASRNAGILHSNGAYVAFLDADDVWAPGKLTEQVAIMEAYEEVGMVYGQCLYWYSWTAEEHDRERDFIPDRRVQDDTMFRPPNLLPHFIRGKTAIPSPSGILVRSSLLDAVGGFEEAFVGTYDIYEDQAFYAKVCLRATVFASKNCWYFYRQHPWASTTVASNTGKELLARDFFLRWLINHMSQQGVQDFALWHALRREQWRLRKPAWLPRDRRLLALTRWIKKWLLRAEEALLPEVLSRRLWGSFS